MSNNKLKHNFGARGGPFRPQTTNQGAKTVSDKDAGKKDFTNAATLEAADISMAKLAIFEKENLELKLQVLQSNVDKAQLQAQLQGDKLKEGLDKATKTWEAAVTALSKKYNLSLDKGDKVDLTTGAITRAETEAQPSNDD